MAERYLEKIKKLRAKGQLDKALQLVDDTLRQGESDLELFRHSISVSMQLSPWMESLSRLKAALHDFSLSELCDGENRVAFMSTVNESVGFRGGLMDFLLNRSSYDPIADWVRLFDEFEQKSLIASWTAAASESPDPVKAAGLRIGAGIGHMVSGQPDDGWPMITEAIGTMPRLLPKVMAYFQKNMNLKTSKLRNKFQIIKILLAAGKKTQALQLLLAMGKERPDNAVKVLMEIPTLFPGDQSFEVIQLQFNLALYLKDPEILERVIQQMKALDDNDLFNFKKQAVVAIEDLELRRSILLQFGRIYLQRESWENAALLLEGLYHEEKHPDIVAMMEEVLDNYPILPQLHFLVGRYHLDHGHRQRAFTYLGAVKDVGEYRERLQVRLEQFLNEGYDDQAARMLFDLWPPGSFRGGLVAFYIIEHQEPVSEEFLDRLAGLSSQREPAPTWFFALIRGYCRTRKFEQAVDYLIQFLTTYPELSAEGVQPAEYLCNHHRADFSDLEEALKDLADQLRPRRAWVALTQHFGEASKRFLAEQEAQHAMIGNETVPPTEEPVSGEEEATDPETHFTASSQEPEYRVFLKQFNDEVRAGQIKSAATLAISAVSENPKWAINVIEQISRLREQQQHEAQWLLAELEILNLTGHHDAAIKLGRSVVDHPAYRVRQSMIHQLMGEAYRAAKHPEEALRSLALASKEPDLYQKNRDALRTDVLPNHLPVLKDVLGVMLAHGDQPLWEDTLKRWYELQPQELDTIVKAQVAFTNQVKTPRAYLDLAYWYLQSGHMEEVNRALNHVDLRDRHIRETLVHLTGLISLKVPDDPKPQFLLGRYYLVHQQVQKAIDTFRNLAQSIPNSAETIYQYLRSYLKQEPQDVAMVHLYGLLIRIALDFGFTRAAVKLLDEFSQKDREAAESLSEGVCRFLLENRKDHLEALYEFGRLLNRWQANNRVLDFDNKATFGNHMVHERIRWFQDAAKVPALADRANLAEAALHLQANEFDEARASLSRIVGFEESAAALDLYTRLTRRIKRDAGILREAGWTACRIGSKHAVPFFKQLLECANLEPIHRLEAYAVLRDAGEEADFDGVVAAYQGDRNAVYAAYREIYGRLREYELQHYRHAGTELPVKAIQWLMHAGQGERAGAFSADIRALADRDRAHLEAQLMCARGEIFQAAWRVSESELPATVRQSLLFQAGLVEKAVLIKEPGVRLAHYLRQSFLDGYQKPAEIQARLTHLQACREAGKVTRPVDDWT